MRLLKRNRAVVKRQQVAEDLRRRIKSGEFKIGDALPGVADLARYYGCSWEVAHRAVWILHGQGLIRKPHQGLDTLVIAGPEPEEPDVRELLGEVQEAIHSLGAKLEALAAALGD
jgi:DNA-binding GntR family transcriptional regulator